MTELHVLTPADREPGMAALQRLLRDEAMNCLQIGGMLPFMRGENEGHWRIVVRDGAVVGLASRTGSYNVILSAMDADALDAVVPFVKDDLPDTPGLIGPRETVTAFAAALGRPITTNMENGIYACTEVVWPESMPPGGARFANDLDLAWMGEWMHAFHTETGESGPPDEFVTSMERKLRTGGYVIWQDEAGVPVSLVGYGNPTPRGIRIGPVFTPPEHRGRGYASYATAVATQHLFDSGRELVFLFTDLANPTSNHVYRSIGYTHQGDVINVRFTDR